jgi:RsiW-degrading membrane proteinase PrsW (M82 family)
MSGGTSTFAVLSITIFGPLVEEVMKVAGLLWIVEKRPFLFTSRLQIIICALCGGLAFAVIENFIYLNVYVPNPPESLVQWRWTVCTFLHCGCSLIAGMGLIRVWTVTMRDRVQPNITNAARYLILAMVVHGVYNGFCVFLSLMKFQF